MSNEENFEDDDKDTLLKNIVENAEIMTKIKQSPIKPPKNKSTKRKPNSARTQKSSLPHPEKEAKGGRSYKLILSAKKWKSLLYPNSNSFDNEEGNFSYEDFHKHTQTLQTHYNMVEQSKYIDYTHVDTLQIGSHGIVFICNKKNCKIPVIVKVVDIRNSVGIPITSLNEVCILQGLNHKNIVKFHDITYTSDFLYMEFEYLINRDLDYHIRVYGRDYLKVDRVKKIIYDILSGLDYLHKRRIIHRDVKPQNVFLKKSMRAVVGDFSVAKKLLFQRGNDLMNEVGTLWYRAPELLAGFRQYDEKVDLFAVGVILLELIISDPSFLFRFPRYDVELQLKVVLEFFGVPSKSDWEELHNMPRVQRVTRNYEFGKPVVLKNIIKEKYASKELLELITGLLKVNPSERVNAEEALDMAWFEELRKEDIAFREAKIARKKKMMDARKLKLEERKRWEKMRREERAKREKRERERLEKEGEVVIEEVENDEEEDKGEGEEDKEKKEEDKEKKEEEGKVDIINFD